MIEKQLISINQIINQFRQKFPQLISIEQSLKYDTSGRLLLSPVPYLHDVGISISIIPSLVDTGLTFSAQLIPYSEQHASIMCAHDLPLEFLIIIREKKKDGILSVINEIKKLKSHDVEIREINTLITF